MTTSLLARHLRPTPLRMTLLVSAALLAGGYLYANRAVSAAPAANGAPPAIPVSVAAAIERKVTEYDEFSGRLEAIDEVAVRPRVSGYIESVHFAPGAQVNKGDTLFVIDPRPFAAELSRAEAALAAAQARLAQASSEAERAGRLLADNAIARREFDERQNAQREAQASVQAAQAAVELARLNLGYTRITAPISGRVSRAEVTVGNLVAAGAGGPALTSIVSTDRIYASFEADEQSFLRYAQAAAKKAADAGSRSGTRDVLRAAKLPIQMGLANESGYPRQGVVEFIDNRLDPKAGTIRVRAVFDNGDGLLTPGLFARLKFGAGGERPAVLISDRAVGTDQSKRFVLVVDAEGKVVWREVKLGPTVDGLRVVRDGLAAGEKIVVAGLQRVRPGAMVATTEVRMDERSAVAGKPGGAPAAASTAAASGAAR